LRIIFDYFTTEEAIFYRKRKNDVDLKTLAEKTYNAFPIVCYQFGKNESDRPEGDKSDNNNRSYDRY